MIILLLLELHANVAIGSIALAVVLDMDVRTGAVAGEPTDALLAARDAVTREARLTWDAAAAVFVGARRGANHVNSLLR